MEFFDIRTRTGELAGKVKEREAVHRDGDWHGTAHIWLVRHEAGEPVRVLLQKRSLEKETFPGCYDTSCAGHLSAGDSYLEGAQRELQEELGIRAREEELFFVGLYSYEVEECFGGRLIRDREVAAVYLYDRPVEEESLQLQQEEVESVRWMDFEELKAHSAAGDPAYCVFEWEIRALEEGFATLGWKGKKEDNMKKWKMAILGAGNIAGAMAGTIAGMEQVEPYAVGSRSLEKAQAFAQKYGFQKAYGSYEELVNDGEVELVYIATPHSEHFANGKLCVEHHKPVLCEKAFTANAEQAKELVRLAEQEKVFLTEAIWVRYMPMLETIRRELEAGSIGKPTMLTANLGYIINQVPRMQKPELAGGALLDVGVYTLNFARMMFGTNIKKVSSVCTYTDTGVDEQNSVTLVYEDGKMAVLNSSMLSLSDRRGTIYGTGGFMVIENINNFESYTIYDLHRQPIRHVERPAQISGYEYEVSACIKALEEGKLECGQMPHEETIRVMELMDSLRREWGICYPFEKPQA